MRGGFSDLVFLEFVVESAAADAQTLGGLLLIPATILKHFHKQFALVLY
jgi:hypothetical protein